VKVLRQKRSTTSGAAGHVNGRVLRLASAAIAVALIAAACGGTEEAAPAPAPAPSTDAPATPEVPEEAPFFDTCDADTYDTRIGGGSPGSSVQVAGIGMAELIREFTGSSRAVVVSTGGAGANPVLVQGNELEMGVSVTTVLAGLIAEDPAAVNWSMAFPGYTIPLYFATTQNSGIETWRDLEGKRLAMGPRGSGVSQTWTAIFEALGFQADLQYIPYDEGNAALRDGSVDAHMLGVNFFPAALEIEAFLGSNIKWIGFEGAADVAAALAASPALQELTLAADVYETLDEDISTVGYIASLIVRNDVPSCVVYDIATAFYSQGETFLQGFFWTEAFQFNLGTGYDTYEAMGAKVHPGYAQYWTEQGVTAPAGLIAEIAE
jgi:uncharacterized protein